MKVKFKKKYQGRKYPWPHMPIIQPMRLGNTSLWARAQNRPAAAFWGDSDRDGVINAFDCAPFDSRRQGPDHERSEADKEQAKKFGIFKKLRIKYNQERSAGKTESDEGYWDWLDRRREEKQEKEETRIANEKRAAELGLLPEDY